MKASADGELHRAVYVTTAQNWQDIAETHRKILAANIGPTDWVLDVGCGWGRLLELLSGNYKGRYTGIDLSPDFIGLAKVKFPGHDFRCGTVDNILPTIPDQVYEWGVFVSIKQMVISNKGNEAWENMRTKCKRVCKRLLILEYDANDTTGEVE